MSRSPEGGERGFHWLDRLHLHPGWLLAIFTVGAVAINLGRWDEWGPEGFRLYLTQAIMQTTLFDFGWVLLIFRPAPVRSSTVTAPSPSFGELSTCSS